MTDLEKPLHLQLQGVVYVHLTELHGGECRVAVLKIVQTEQLVEFAFENTATAQGSHMDNHSQKDLVHFSIPRTKSYGIEVIKYDDKKLKFCTGLAFCQFVCLLRFLVPDAKKLIELLQPRCQGQGNITTEEAWCRRKLSQNESLVALVWGLLALLHSDLAHTFEQFGSFHHYTQGSVCVHSVFSDTCSHQVVPIKNLLKCFGQYKNIRTITVLTHLCNNLQTMESKAISIPRIRFIEYIQH